MHTPVPASKLENYLRAWQLHLTGVSAAAEDAATAATQEAEGDGSTQRSKGRPAKVAKKVTKANRATRPGSYTCVIDEAHLLSIQRRRENVRRGGTMGSKLSWEDPGDSTAEMEEIADSQDSGFQNTITKLFSPEKEHENAVLNRMLEGGGVAEQERDPRNYFNNGLSRVPVDTYRDFPTALRCARKRMLILLGTPTR